MHSLIARGMLLHPSPTLVYVWIYFNLIPNTIVLPILVATFLFSKTVTRHPTLINVCVTWILSGIFACLLFFAGQHVGPEPDHALCVAQTSLMYGITPMWSVAILMLVYHMSISVDGDTVKSKVGKTKLYIMLAAPYIIQLAFSIATLVLALQHPKKVSRNRRVLYCSIKNHTLSATMSVFTFIICVGITAIEGHLAITLYRNWRGTRSAGWSSGVDPQFLIRVLAFGLYIFMSMIVSLLTVLDQHSVIPDMYAATAGTALILIFGTQVDIFRAWCFWRRGTPVLVTPRSAMDGSQPNWYDSGKHDATEVTDQEKTMWGVRPVVVV